MIQQLCRRLLQLQLYPVFSAAKQRFQHDFQRQERAGADDQRTDELWNEL